MPCATPVAECSVIATVLCVRCSSVVARPQNANAGLRVSQSVVNSAAAAMHLVLALGEILARLRDMAATDFAERVMVIRKLHGLRELQRR